MMPERIVVIVQARVSSTRLPGKVLMDLGDRTVLDHVLERCLAVPDIAAVCCATVAGDEGDPIDEVACKAGVEVYRGDVDDVLGRYAGAARTMDADVVVRVTSDCPLIDPSVVGDVVALRARTRASLACNNLRPEWPHGLDCEAIDAAWLEAADRHAVDDFDREHVTPWIRRRPDAHLAHLAGPMRDAHAYRWTLDYPEDLEFLRAIQQRLPDGPAAYSYRTVLGILAEEPTLGEINAMHVAPR